MGMGELFLNYVGTVRQCASASTRNVCVAARKTTISTCGLPDEIRRFSAEGLQAELSISLHAADDHAQPACPHQQAISAVGSHERGPANVQRTHRTITFEYVMLKESTTARRMPRNSPAVAWLACKGTLIPFNADSSSQFEPSTSAGVRVFQQTLERLKMTVTLRRSRGEDIDGACGQLRRAQGRGGIEWP